MSPEESSTGTTFRTERSPHHVPRSTRNAQVSALQAKKPRRCEDRGRDHYLGKYGSQDSQEKYHRLVAEFPCIGKTPPPTEPSPHARSLSWSRNSSSPLAPRQTRYVKIGNPTSEIRSFRTALRPVRQLYGRSRSPVSARWRGGLPPQLIEAGICRKRINRHVGRIRQVFKWGVATGTGSRDRLAGVVCRGRSSATGGVGNHPISRCPRSKSRRSSPRHAAGGRDDRPPTWSG